MAFLTVQAIQCPAFDSFPAPLKVHHQGDRSFHSFAGQSLSFSCPNGYRLRGPSNTTCLTNGNIW